MKTKFLLIILLSFLLQGQSQNIYNLWKNVNENLENNLPETANSSLDKIEEKALKENNQKELLKTFLYRFKIFYLSEENPIETSIKFAEENIYKLQEPEKAIFNIAITSLYESAQLSAVSNQPMSNEQQSLPIKFWDKATFERVINKYYENALSDVKSLQQSSSESYKDILAINDETADFDFNIEPTLYDYVVHKIINYNNISLLCLTDLYQNLIDFDKKNNYTDAAIYNEIQKIKYEYKTTDDYETYLNSLKKIKNENINNPLVTSVMALQAEFLNCQQSAISGQQSGRTSVTFNKQSALDICDEATKLFPDSKGAKQCESIRSEILQKELTFSMQNVVLPNKPIKANISYRNLTNPHYRIYKISQDKLEDFHNKSHDEIAKILLRKNHIVENHIVISDNKDYATHSLSINLPELECGIYYILFSKDDKFSDKENELPAIHSFQVSRLSYVVTNENDNFVIYVLDRESGKPLKDVNVNIYKQNYDYKQNKLIKTNIRDLKTDKEGCAKIAQQNNQFLINLYKGNDCLISDIHFYNYQSKNDKNLRERTYFFTDRAIYRPGQTVYFKGVILNENSQKKELLVGKETKVTLKDSNWQDVTTQTFTTNDFGSFDGSFVIPNKISNGFFQIKNESGSISFKVEEYKRPTFEIIFNNPDKSFKLNDSVDISGLVKAYAGFGLDNINYNYTIVRRAYFPYRYLWFNNYDSNEKQIAFGEGTTDEKGNFDISFNLIPDKNGKDKLPVYEYIITINATNAQGETQSKTYTLKASEIDLIIDIDNNDAIVSKDSLNLITFDVKNLKENPVEAKIIRKISHVETYGRTSLIYEDTINVNGNYGLFQNVNKNLETGKYIVELISVEDEKAKISKEIIIIDLESKKMPFDTMCISYYDKKSAQPNEIVNFYLGSSAKDVNVYVMIKHGDEIRYYKRKTFSDKVLKFSYKIKEEDRGMISFQAFFVKDNTINIINHNVAIPYENLRLDIRLDVERDDLLPGAQEKWNLTVKNFKDEGVVANLLAGMYDASLDVFAKNHWYFDVIPENKYSTSPRTDDSFQDFHSEASFNFYGNVSVFDYFLLSMVGVTPYHRSPRYAGGGIMYSMAVAEKSNRDAAFMEETIMEYDYVADDISQEEQSIEDQEPVLRENFSETAFFYPNLITNDDGSLTLSFTMPDALTRWNLMMMAYTKDLKVGTLNKTFTTSKPLMIMSDMPRFCYENDTLWIVANVISQQSAISCQPSVAKLEIFDALTMQPLDLILSEQEINLGDISEGSSKSVRWKVVVDDDDDNDFSLLVFRFSVVSDNFSDAEQHLLPILSDEVFMTETYPLTIEPHSSKTFDFNFDNENERNQGVTLNYCSNPVWYAIQALPYLSQEVGDYANVAFNIFYANSLASYIAHNIPNFLNYINEWKINSPDALMSALEKDENLKAIMLQETPWVLEAKNETEQKLRLANLFDLNALSYKNNESLNLIQEKQSANGGWSWMPNMPESKFITQYILSGFGKLYKMNVINSLTSNQQENVNIISQKAINYLTNEIIESYNNIIYKSKYHISHSLINELYALSFFNFDERNKYKEAKDFFIDQLQKDWRDFDFGTQAKSALILYRDGNKDAAQLIVRSLKERMNQLKNTTDVATQTLVMESFKGISADKQILNEMMICLLNNKRTNMWENAMMTVDAVYAIFYQQSIETYGRISELQSVFVQRYWNAEELKDFKNLTLENQNNNIAWGGLFRQYFVSIDEVRKHKSQLNVERELFVERNNENGSYLVPIKDTEIKVGDKVVVNLTIEASQDMEFVFLKDLRAACLEATEQMSSYKYHDEMFYYQSNSDTYMGFYFDKLSKGKHKVSYSMYVTKEGSFSNGYALIQCLYAPEFSGYSEGMRIKVENQNRL